MASPWRLWLPARSNDRAPGGESRARAVEGLMLTHRDAIYRVGRTRDPPAPIGGLVSPDASTRFWSTRSRFTAGAPASSPITRSRSGTVLRTMPRSASVRRRTARGCVAGRRADPRTPVPVPFAKAYSGLTDAEIRQVDVTVRRSTIERFGRFAAGAGDGLRTGIRGVQRSRATAAVSRSVSPGCCAGAATTRCTRPTRLRCSRIARAGRTARAGYVTDPPSIPVDSRCFGRAAARYRGRWLHPAPGRAATSGCPVGAVTGKLRAALPFRGALRNLLEMSR